MVWGRPLRWPPLVTTSSPWPLLESRSTSPSPSCLGETNRPLTTSGKDDHDGGLKLWLGHTRVAQLVASWHPGYEQMEREWENEEEMEREWENEEEMEREWENGERMRKWRESGNGDRFTLYISSFSLYFLPLYPFLISKIVSFYRKMLNTVLLSRMSQKTYYMRHEKMILGWFRCEKAPQVVRAWLGDWSTNRGEEGSV